MSLVSRTLFLAGWLLSAGGAHSLVSPQRTVQHYGGVRRKPTNSDHRPTPLRSRGASSSSSSSLERVTTALRGGALLEAVLDVGRENLKLQAMTTYPTITALVMNASLRLYTSQKFEMGMDENGNRPDEIKRLESVFKASTILCIVSGMFTAVLFSILGIYSREALGMGNNSGYVAFTAATAIYRKWGFRAFLTTCLSFVASFVISIVEKTSDEDRIGQYILAASIVLLAFGVVHLQTVLALATKFIYTPEFKILNNIV
jgi:hypothetical protein